MFNGPNGPLTSKANWRKLEVVQNIGLRIIIFSPCFVTNKIISSSACTSTIKQSIITNSKNLFHRNSNSTFHYIRILRKSTLATGPSLKTIKQLSYGLTQTILYSQWDHYSAATSFCRAAVRHMMRHRPHYGNASGAAMKQNHAHVHN